MYVSNKSGIKCGVGSIRCDIFKLQKISTFKLLIFHN